ncbi:MAG TPA: DUF1343 domain-containing protein [Alphaproteobacteria bacterium]|nr:DUF1343 domain-containing protein [Alphaproteobacteria bacterium]
MTSFRPGVDRLADHARLFSGRRLGLVVNHASLGGDLVPTVDRLRALPGVRIERLFTPEHGLHGVLQDGEEDRDGVDPATGLPVISLYGPRRRPEPGHLAELDAVIWDIVDVGCRAYTFLSTLLGLAATAAEGGCDLVVLDRPNPAGGAIEGGGVAAAEANFVAAIDVPLRHGLTLGELARLHCFEAGLPPPEIVPVGGWRRSPALPGDFWIAPSPNLPTAMAALAYAGMVLIEGTGLSEGRGTTRPFTLVGAPGLDGPALARRLADRALPGVRARPAAFRPATSKHAGAVCHGVELWIDDRATFRALPLVLEILAHIRDHGPDGLELTPSMRRLTGGTLVPDWCAAKGAAPAELLTAWRDDQDRFRVRADAHLLYGSLG